MNHRLKGAVNRVFRRIGSVLISLLAVVLGVIASVITFALGLNLGLVFATILGALVLFFVTWLLTALAHRIWRSPRAAPRLALLRRKSPYVIAGTLLVIVGLLAGTTILAPLPDEPIIEAGRPESSSWTLSTGSQINYWRFAAEGSGNDDTPIVFVHGGPGGYAQKKDIEYFQSLVKTGHDVYLYDQPGAGASANLNIDEYTIERSVADLEAIRTEIGAAQINLIGHSAGGYVVEAYAAAHADRVAHLVLISPGGYDSTPDAAERIETEWEALEKHDPGITKTIVDGSHQIQALPVRAMAAVLVRQLVGPTPAENLLDQDDSKRAVAAAFVPINLHANLAWTDSYEATWNDTLRDLKAVKIPSLLMRAEYDYIPWVDQYPYAEVNSEFTTVYIEEAFHSPWEAQPETVFGSLNAFFNDEPQPGGVYKGTSNPVLVGADGVSD